MNLAQLKAVVTDIKFAYVTGPAVLMLSYKLLGETSTIAVFAAYLVVSLLVGGVRPAKDPNAAVARALLFGSLCVMAMAIDAAGVALPLVILAFISLVKGLRHETRIQANTQR